MNEPEPGAAAGPGSPDAPGGTADKVLPERRAWSRSFRWTLELLAIIAAAFVVALLLQQFVVKPFAIPSPSMEPTLLGGDRVLVNRLVYHFHPPERGDIIVFHPPGRDSSDPFIKRVVAIAGDTVAVRDGALWLNGVRQDEPYVKEYPLLDEYPEVTIKPGFVWAMGDNRNNSGDSRVFGPVSVDLIMGKAFAIYWPPKRIRGL